MVTSTLDEKLQHCQCLHSNYWWSASTEVHRPMSAPLILGLQKRGSHVLYISGLNIHSFFGSTDLVHVPPFHVRVSEAELNYRLHQEVHKRYFGRYSQALHSTSSKAAKLSSMRPRYSQKLYHSLLHEMKRRPAHSAECQWVPCSTAHSSKQLQSPSMY